MAKYYKVERKFIGEISRFVDYKRFIF